MINANTIKENTRLVLPDIIKIRHTLHENPELSFKEFNTAKLICSALDELGIKYTSGIAGTGILAEIYGLMPLGSSSKTVLLRGDMDALPVKENTGLPFSSKCDNVMHACGHDVHTSIILCCAAVINRLKNRFSGCVKFMFQPGEETSGGAEPMIRAGILENPKVDSCAALHIEPSLRVGEARFKPGSAYSSPDEFEIKIIGKGGHGAQPHLCIDPIVIASEIISGLQTIASRIIDPFEPAVVSVCAVHGGDAYNVIPDTVTIGGTARSFNLATRDMLDSEIESTVKSVCKRYGASYKYKFDRLFPPLINDEETILRLKDSAEKYLNGNIIVGGDPTTAGEDFAYLPMHIKNSALFWLGCTEADDEPHPLHSDKLIVSDSCIEYGAEILTDYALSFLSN